MKVIFLDRDGVINEYPGDFKYVTQSKDFKFLPGVEDALRELNKAGYKIFIISNQAGVRKGIFSQRSLDDITQYMLSELKKSGVEISGVYYCTHQEEDKCCCRKPKTGLIEAAFKKLGVGKLPVDDASECFFIGDTMRDIQTGKTAGCKTILVFSGKESLENKDNWIYQPDFTACDLSEAAQLILTTQG